MKNDSDLLRLKYQVSQLKKTVARYEKAKGQTEAVIEAMRSAISVVKPPPVWKPPKKKVYGKEQVMVVELSDCQIGEKIRQKDTGGFGEYNIDVFGERTKTLTNGVIRIAELQRNICPVRKLHVFVLGDMGEGIGIFPSQSAYLETDPIEQMFEGLEYIGNCLRTWSGQFEEVIVDCVAGNHGVVRKEGKETKDRFYMNWDYIFYRFLEQKLESCPNVKMKIPTAWWMIRKILGRRFYLEHGNFLVPYRHWGISWYSLERAVSRTLTLVRSIGQDFTDICMGHIHTPFTWEVQSHMEVICNGTFSGEANMLAASKMKLRTRPTQMAFFVHPEHGIAARFPIRLEGKNGR